MQTSKIFSTLALILCMYGCGGSGGSDPALNPTALQDAIIEKLNDQGCLLAKERSRLRNKSKDKTIQVTVKRLLKKGVNETETTSVHNLQPGVLYDLGCSGCGFTTTGHQCLSYTVAAAVYL